MEQPKQYRFKKIQGLHVLQSNPALRILVLDISDTCDFACRYCYGKTESFKTIDEPLQYEDYERLFEEASQNGVKTMWFLGAHENTLSPLYLRLLEIAESYGFFTVTFSNGAGFGDDRVARRIFGLTAMEFCTKVASHTGSSVVIKRDSLDSKTQNALANSPEATVRIETAIRNIRQTALALPGVYGLPRFGLNSVLTTDNSADVADLFRFCLQNNLAYFCDALLMSGDAKESLVPSEKQIEFALTQIKIDIEYFGLDMDPKQVINFYDECCLLFDNYLFINHDGGVLPCAGFPEVSDRLGHISDGLPVLWERKIRMIHSYRQLVVCAKCPCRAHLEDRCI
jgi:radical SAM protein with 4Fe4S-binding SPASM domain